jgi:hypothetical protein
MPWFTSLLRLQPAFSQQRSKIENDDEDENENDWVSDAGWFNRRISETAKAHKRWR